MLIETLIAMLLLGTGAMWGLHGSWQGLQSQARHQQWLDAIEWLDNASTALHLWPQSFEDWQRLSLNAKPATPATDCSSAPCTLGDWQRAQVQWGAQQLRAQLPQAQLEWLPTQALVWQAADRTLQLPLQTWQLRWVNPANPNDSTGPEAIQLHLVP